MGSAHCRTIAGEVAGADLAAVADADVARARALADELGARAFEDPFELVRDGDVDAVRGRVVRRHPPRVRPGLPAG